MTNQQKTEVEPPVRKRTWLSPAAVLLDTTIPEPIPEKYEPEIALILPTIERAIVSPATAPSVPWLQRFRTPTLIAAGVLIVVGGALGVFLHSHSLGKIQIAGLPATHSPADKDLEGTLQAAVASYKLTIQAADGKTTSYTLKDAGLAPDVQATIKAAARQRNYSLWHTEQVPLVVRTDAAKLSTFITENTIQATEPAKDATLMISDGKIVKVAEQKGVGHRITNAPIAVLAAAQTLEAKPLKMELGVIEPRIYQSGLASTETKLNKILAQKITLTIGSDTKTVSAAEIGRMLTLTPNPVKRGIDISANTPAVNSYLDAVTTPYTAAAPDTVTPVGADGTISIVTQSGNGSIQGKQALADAIASKLLAAEDQQHTVALTGSPGKTLTAHAQPKWLLVNLSTKRMYAYENTKLVRSFLVSAGAAETPTVTGTYKVYAKYATQDMRGANADGTNYFQPNVQYVNYFYKDYAVHGNYWRPTSYFGNVNSSHGCVGIVNNDASWVHTWAPIGTTVVVHT